MVSESAGVKGESAGWPGFKRGGFEADGKKGKRWGETRPYRKTELFQKKSKRNNDFTEKTTGR